MSVLRNVDCRQPQRSCQSQTIFSQFDENERKSRTAPLGPAQTRGNSNVRVQQKSFGNTGADERKPLDNPLSR